MAKRSQRSLFHPTRYAQAIERLARRRASSPTAVSLEQSGVSLTRIRERKERVARLLVKDLLAGRAAPTPGRAHRSRIDGKERILYAFPIIEMVVQTVVADWLTEQTADRLPSSLYSYQIGTPYHLAVRDFARFVRTQNRLHPDPRTRGLYVLRRDVRSYFDSIPVHDASPLWRVLKDWIGPTTRDTATWSLVRRAVRPALVSAHGELLHLERGIPTGSPVANVVANIYLTSLDQKLSRIPRSYYARYGDDMLLAHPGAEETRASRRIIEQFLEDKGLHSHPGKAQDLYLNASGRHSSAWFGACPAAAVDFLGHRVSANGTTSLPPAKTREILLDARRRAIQAACCGTTNGDETVRVARVVGAINRLLDPKGVLAHPYARALRNAVTDRGYLKWLDHELALTVLEAVFQRRSVRDFRRLTPRAMRRQFGLQSLVHNRNRIDRRTET